MFSIMINNLFLLKSKIINTNFTKVITVFAGGNLIAMGLRLVGGILLTRSIDPENLGLFSSIGLFLSYSIFLQLGILDGLGRELPFQIGAGDRHKAEAYASNAKFWSIVIGCLSAFVFFIVGGYYFLNNLPKNGLGWFVYGLSTFVNFYAVNYLQITYRTKGDFVKLTIINIAINAVGVASILLVKEFSFYGLCFRQVLMDLSTLVLFSIYCPIKVKSIWNFQGLRELLKVGFPIFIVGLIYLYWTTINSTLVLYLLGTVYLGYNQFVLMVATALEVISLSLSQILYPRLSESYGRYGRIDKLWNMIKLPMVLVFIIQIPLIILAWLFLPRIIEFLFPSYLPAAQAVQWALISYSLLTFKPIALIFNVIKRQDLLLYSILLGYLINGLALLLIFPLNMELVSFPIALFFGRLAYLLTAFLLAMKLYRKEKLKYSPNTSESLDSANLK